MNERVNEKTYRIGSVLPYNWNHGFACKQTLVECSERKREFGHRLVWNS